MDPLSISSDRLKRKDEKFHGGYLMSDYIRPGTQFPKYYQFPEFLIRAPISQAAKLAYMVLYDRARLSLKNDWMRLAALISRLRLPMLVSMPLRSSAQTAAPM